MIPRIIHYCWFGGKPKPESVQKCIASWKKHCPDYEIKEWNESNINMEKMPLYVKQAYEAKVWGFVPDYIRLWIVYNYGGIYLDTDVQMIRPFDDLLSNRGYVGFEADNYINLGIGFGAEKGHEMILDHMQLYEKLRFMNEDGSLNKTPSPVITTDFLANRGVILGKHEKQSIDGLMIFPSDYFSPKSFDTGITTITANTYSIHQYDASWFTEEERKEHEKNLRDYKRQRIIKLPNRMLLKLFGAENYNHIKRIIKGKG